MTCRSLWERGSFGLALLAIAASAWSASAVSEQVLEVDLEPAIAAAMKRPERFAVDVAHFADFQHEGSWQRAAGFSTWRYKVRIPGAVSMSFHASTYRLPAGASLTVGDSSGASFTYSPDMGGAHGLWSRLSRGDTLSFELRVATADEASAGFSIASLQAGYRLLGGGGPDHPYYRKLQSERALALSASSCTKNFACYATPENSNNADATAALVIGGVALCSGTLINNQRSDGAPYMLTARHCQDTPYSGVVAYWDAVTPCGQPLGTVFDTNTPAYLHTTDTVFEQQDVWMIRLTGPLNATRVYFAGWDASGAAFTGGYSPHHALGRSRQYTEWSGQAILYPLPRTVLGVGYDSSYWGVVNSIGNIGSGASGGGLFNSQHRVVGTLSLAYLDDAGEGMCPANPPPEPSTSTAVALYNALAEVWDTNADATSYTNPVTLKSLLDPDNTGNRVVDGFGMLNGVYISANPNYGSAGQPVTLTWNGGTATSCTASGGNSGDDWAGPRAPNGTYEVTAFASGTTTYSIRCTDGTRFATRSVRVEWNAGFPNLFLTAWPNAGFVGGTFRVSWNSNLTPCVASGGMAGDGWAGSKPSRGYMDVPVTQLGTFNYTLSCGSGARQATQSTPFTASPPAAALEASSNNMRVGSQVIIVTTSYGGLSCERTGGVPGDGWAGSTQGYDARVTSSTPGTYRYTLTCTGGPTPAVANLDLTWTNDPPSATLTASTPTAYVASGPIGDFVGTSPYVIEFSWVSNVAPCQLSYDGPGNEDGPGNPAMDRPGISSVNSAQSVPGTYVYRVTCINGADTSTATTTVDFLPPPPRLGFDVPENPVGNEPISISWISDVSPCTGSGGVAGDGWAGPHGSQGTTTFTLQTPGSYTYSISCGVAPNVLSASRILTISAPAVSFEPHPTRIVSGTGIALRWNSTVGPCRHIGDWADANEYPANGANVIVYGGVGVQNYGVRCGGPTIVEATTQVDYRPQPSADIMASVDHTSVNFPVTLSWTSQNAAHCAVQGTGSDDWSGELPTSGSRVITRSTPGSFGFYINCDDYIDAVMVEWRAVVKSPTTPAGPAITFSIDHTSRQSGDPVTLSWTTTHAAVCHGSGGVNGDSWAGTLPVSGTRSIVVSGAGTFTWGLTCDGAPPSASASVSAIYAAVPPPQPPPPPASPPSQTPSSGGGGGGRVDPTLLSALGILLLAFRTPAMRRFARRRAGAYSARQ